MAFFTQNRRIKLIPAIFCVLVGIFLVITSLMLIPAFRKHMRFIFIPVLVAFFLSGLLLIISTVKEKDKGKNFLLLTGASSVGFFVSVFLHNFFYGLGVITSHVTVLSYLFEGLHAVFFIVGVFVCPLGFLAGVVGSIVMFIKKRKRR